MIKKKPKWLEQGSYLATIALALVGVIGLVAGQVAPSVIPSPYRQTSTVTITETQTQSAAQIIQTVTVGLQSRTVVLTANDAVNTNIESLFVTSTGNYSSFYIQIPNAPNYDGSDIYFAANSTGPYTLGTSCGGAVSSVGCHGAPMYTVHVCNEGKFLGIEPPPAGYNITIDEEGTASSPCAGT